MERLLNKRGPPRLGCSAFFPALAAAVALLAQFAFLSQSVAADAQHSPTEFSWSADTSLDAAIGDDVQSNARLVGMFRRSSPEVEHYSAQNPVELRRSLKKYGCSRGFREIINSRDTGDKTYQAVVTTKNGGRSGKVSGVLVSRPAGTSREVTDIKLRKSAQQSEFKPLVDNLKANSHESTIVYRRPNDGQKALHVQHRLIKENFTAAKSQPCCFCGPNEECRSCGSYRPAYEPQTTFSTAAGDKAVFPCEAKLRRRRHTAGHRY